MLLSPKPACGGFDFDRATLISSTYPLKALDLLNSKLLPIRFRHQKIEVEFSQRLDVGHGTFTGDKKYEFGSA